MKILKGIVLSLNAKHNNKQKVNAKLNNNVLIKSFNVFNKNFSSSFS